MNTKVKVIKASNTGARNRNSIHLDLKRVAAYCRVSTDSKDQLESYKSQVDYYTNLIKNNKNWTLAGIYADEATTGTTATKRADFMRLISDCQNGDIDMIITKSISRFARNTLDTLKYVRLLKENNVGVVFEEENIDTLTMDGELLLTILSSVAQQEVENTSAHVKKGLKMKMEKGELIGFQGCLGYDYDPITKRRLANFGESDKYHIENHHEPIISKEDFEKAQEIRLRRAQNRNTIANKDRKREKLSRQYAFSSMLECGFCGEILSRRTWHTSSIYKKINWQCVKSTKKGKKYCPHSKGIQEAAIEKAFVESYRQLCHADSTVIDDFLKIVEEEINDNTLVKDLKKIENQLNRIISQERKLVDLHLEDSIDEEVYAKKYKKLTKQKEELLDEKKTLELTIKDENSIKERLKQFKKVLENKEIIEEFNRTVFESIVDKVVVGRIDKDGTVHPYDLTFYFKTGVKDSQNSNNFKDKRKNAKDNDINKLCSYKNDEDKKLCSQAKDNARRSPNTSYEVI